MTNEPAKSKVAEATLELGRNWAVAIAVAAFGVAAFHTEPAYEMWQNRDYPLLLCLTFAAGWIILAIARFLDVVGVRTKTWVQKSGLLAIVFLLVCVGIGLLLATASYADNANAVRICSEFADKPNSAAHKASACQRIYKLRAERHRRLMGE